MSQVLRPAFVLVVLFTLLTGVAYPLAITAIAQALLPSAANGSIASSNGKTVGSALIAQKFVNPAYFHARPSAAGSDGYDASASSGSNLGPLSQKLVDRVKADVQQLRSEGAQSIPADAVTTSASGLDPDISPANAALQVARVAKARGVDADRVRSVLAQQTQHKLGGLAGQTRINVLLLNVALDTAFGGAPK